MLPSLNRKLRGVTGINTALQDIIKTCHLGDQVIAVEAAKTRLHNTKLTLLLKNGKERVHFYNRVDITQLLKGVAVSSSSLAGMINELNIMGYDFTEDDLELVDGKLSAKSTSLAYFGSMESKTGNATNFIQFTIQPFVDSPQTYGTPPVNYIQVIYNGEITILDVMEDSFDGVNRATKVAEVLKNHLAEVNPNLSITNKVVPWVKRLRGDEYYPTGPIYDAQVLTITNNSNEDVDLSVVGGVSNPEQDPDAELHSYSPILYPITIHCPNSVNVINNPIVGHDIYFSDNTNVPILNGTDQVYKHLSEDKGDIVEQNPLSWVGDPFTSSLFWVFSVDEDGTDIARIINPNSHQVSLNAAHSETGELLGVTLAPNPMEMDLSKIEFVVSSLEHVDSLFHDSESSKKITLIVNGERFSENRSNGLSMIEAVCDIMLLTNKLTAKRNLNRGLEILTIENNTAEDVEFSISIGSVNNAGLDEVYIPTILLKPHGTPKVKLPADAAPYVKFPNNFLYQEVSSDYALWRGKTYDLDVFIRFFRRFSVVSVSSSSLAGMINSLPFCESFELYEVDEETGEASLFMTVNLAPYPIYPLLGDSDT